ncbi:MAG TPA: hypothetical protein DGT23_35745 [Micromonosporaceae bacterium]|nr:hypothetical protein [Micromonosporaceae bacterium]
MHDVLILSLVDGDECGRRVPVLHCADALREAGARVETFVAGSDLEIDEVLGRLDGPPRPDGLVFPDADMKTRLVVAVESDGQLRHVMRRLVRRYAPPPSKRPNDLPANRTLPDLPAIGILPLDAGTAADLAAQLGLPRTPAEVAAAVLGDARRKLDLLRHDGGSVTLDGVLLGATDDHGTPLAWRGRIEVDDAVLSQGSDPIVALSVANAGGTATLDGLPLVTAADPSDGLIDVAIAVPVAHKPLFGKQRLRYEVRRARGRAVAVTPHETELPYLDDGVAGTLTRKRSWWIEPGAWSVYTASGRNEP